MRNSRSSPRTLCDPLSSRQDDDSLVRADGDGGNHGDSGAEGEADEADAVAEVDAVALPPGAEDLVVAAGVVDRGSRRCEESPPRSSRPASTAPARSMTGPTPGSPRKKEWKSAKTGSSSPRSRHHAVSRTGRSGGI